MSEKQNQGSESLESRLLLYLKRPTAAMNQRIYLKQFSKVKLTFQYPDCFSGGFVKTCTSKSIAPENNMDAIQLITRQKTDSQLIEQSCEPFLGFEIAA